MRVYITTLAISGILSVASPLASAQGTWRVSVDSSGGQGNSYSQYPSISGDGRFVAFFSDASNLVSSDTNGGFGIAPTGKGGITNLEVVTFQ